MKTNMNFNLFMPTKLLFGCGKLNELGNQMMPGKKALLLISNGKSVRMTGTLDRTIEQLGKAHIAMCSVLTFTKILRRRSSWRLLRSP